MADVGSALGAAGSGAATGAAVGSIVPGIGTAIGGVVGGVAGLLGNVFANSDQDKANAALNNAYAYIQQIGAPPDLAKQIVLDQFHQVGLYNPQFEQAVNQQFSAVANVQDSSAKDAQTQALGQLQQVSKLGMTAQDLAQAAQARTQINKDAAARAATLTQNMQARGMAGSGAELASQLSNSQNATNQENQNGLTIAGQANQRALEALSSAGNLAGNIRNTDIGLNTTRANAQDAMNRFNVQNQQAVNNQNVNAANQAQQYNLGTQQQLANANTASQNQELAREVAAQQTMYQDNLAYGKELGGASSTVAANDNQQAQRTRENVAGAGNALGQGASSIYSYLNNAKPGATANSTTVDPNDLNLKNKNAYSVGNEYSNADNASGGYQA